MAKENFILFVVIITTLMIAPGTGFAQKTNRAAIKTTQHVIVIDPGHGGTQNGLVTSSGLKEKTIALTLAEKTAQKLESRYNVFLTRTRDIDIPPRERIFITNKNSADLFLCIHLHYSSEPSGFFYYFDPPEPYRQSILASKNTWKSQSLLHQSGSKQAIDSFLNIFSAHKKANHFFSKGAPVKPLEGATMPAILIEPLSISLLPQHPDEIEKILDEYALLISKSIDLYFKK
ncbi:MAG: N-acetylmuramoyl-L-alanine amidase [Desulfobacula sp.]|uniref:N-acetylmuramoyl-L-alanine amidase family protein n=1 Tax=Desulfobacula sp. TaxID=2593537 RepID=UPI0025BDDC0B|nr:N-acetylmuramoyl-L-alanine amidase [Desulfobacula sp.]MCD4721737.1 N-acetylmuramoyl-L-alanine amidase [Desulfobacula sp.]